VAAHALNADLEGDPGAKRGFFEDEREEFSAQRVGIAGGIGLDVGRDGEKLPRVRGTPFRSSEQIVRDQNRRCQGGCCHFFLLPRCGVSRVPRRFRRRHGFRNMAEYFFENSEEFPNLFCADDERGEKAQSKFVRAIDEQAAVHGVSDEGIAIDGEFYADHEAFAADFLDERIIFRELFDSCANFGSARGGICEDFCFVENFEEFERDGADHGAAAEGCAMNAGAYASGDGFGGQDCAEREASSERLGDGYKVWLGRKLLIGEVAAGTAEPALNFVGDEQGIVILSERAGAIPKGFADGVDATFALDGFEDYGADVVVEFGLEVGYIIEFDEFDSRDERSEGQSIFFGGGDADGAEGATVKGIFERENAVLWIRRG